MRRIYWYCLDIPDSEEFVSEALQELSNNLRKFPTRIEVAIEKLPDELQQDVCSQLQENMSFPETSAEIVEILYDGRENIPELIVFCRRNSDIAIRAREENPSAQWGAACGRLAVVWKRDKMLLWHEALHLLGAKDCYIGKDKRGYCMCFSK